MISNGEIRVRGYADRRTLRVYKSKVEALPPTNIMKKTVTWNFTTSLLSQWQTMRVCECRSSQIQINRKHTRVLFNSATNNLHIYKFGSILTDSYINDLGAWEGYVHNYESKFGWTSSSNLIKVLKFKKEHLIPEDMKNNLKCSIIAENLIGPIVASVSRTYERYAMQTVFTKKHKSPRTNAVLTSKKQKSKTFFL